MDIMNIMETMETIMEIIISILLIWYVGIPLIAFVVMWAFIIFSFVVCAVGGIGILLLAAIYHIVCAPLIAIKALRNPRQLMRDIKIFFSTEADES